VASLFDNDNFLIEWMSKNRIMSEWPECGDVFLEKLSADFPRVVRLPTLSCKTVGGVCSDSTQVSTAWSMLRYAAELFDAVQDGDNLPESVNDQSSAIEFANGLIFSAFNAIATIHDPIIVRQLTNTFSDLAYQASYGLQLSQKYRRKDDVTLEMYWQATILKSGSIFRAGMEGGAIVGRAASDEYTALGNFGNALGVIRQVIDDCRDVFDDPEISTYEVTLPLLLLAEKMGKPISVLVDQFGTKEVLLKALNKNEVPEMITSVLLEWRRRAMENLMILKQSSETQALETILQDFITKPWLNFD